jgi:hypothetical protein
MTRTGVVQTRYVSGASVQPIKSTGSPMQLDVSFATAKPPAAKNNRWLFVLVFVGHRFTGSSHKGLDLLEC